MGPRRMLATPEQAGDRQSIQTVEERARLWAQSLLAEGDKLIHLLTEVATRDSATDELHRSVRALMGAPWEITRSAPPAGRRIAVFLPSNNLLYSYALFGLLPSLYSEQVLIRPSSRTRSTVLRLHAHLGGLPGSRVHLADLSQREFLRECAGADAIVFTGRFENMSQIAEALRPAPPILMLGSGPNPVVVGPDADLAQAVPAIVAARLYNAGQDCLCPDLVIVHESRRAEFTEALAAEIARVPRGNRSQSGPHWSPLVYPDAFADAVAFLDAHREGVLTGGRVSAEESRIEPSVVRIAALQGFHPPELFSPIFCVASYGDPEEIRTWLTSEDELARGMYLTVFGESGLGEPRIGTTVNCGPHSAFDIEDGNRPFGGYGVRASARVSDGSIEGRPLLLSREVARSRTPGGVETGGTQAGGIQAGTAR